MKHCVILQLTFAVILLSKLTAFAKYIETCNRDILIILDTSKSIRKVNFDNQIKPFLRNFTSDKALNLGSNGTEVALLLFSEYAKTKLVIPFHEKYDAEKFKRYVDNLLWKNVAGDYTRTDRALEIANNEIFVKASPKNNRNDSSDVIILITDGQPKGEGIKPRKLRKDVLAYAQQLKQKDVLIIGIGVGDHIKDKKFWNLLKNISSPGRVFNKEFYDLESIERMLVNVSCEEKNFPPGLICNCPVTRSTIYLKPGEKSRNISWKRPDPQCPAGVSGPIEIHQLTGKSALTSPASLGVGQHEIIYRYLWSENQAIDCTVKFDIRECECPQEELKVVSVKPRDTKADLKWQVPVPSCMKCPSPMMSQSLSVGEHSMAYEYNIADQFNMTCRVNFEVKGSLCRGSGYDQNSQECCCGVIHDKKPWFECCGENHFKTTTHQCCDENIQKKGEKCLAF